MKFRLLVIALIIGALAFVAVVCFLNIHKKQSLQNQLIVASGIGDIQKIKKLLLLGVNVNCKACSPDAATPLIWAVRSRREKAVEVLLGAGANPNIPCGTGETALFFAMGNPEDDTSAKMIKTLISDGAKATEKEQVAFESLPKDDRNRIAYEDAVKAKQQN